MSSTTRPFHAPSPDALTMLAGRALLNRGLAAPARGWLGRPFPRRAERRVVLWYSSNPISLSQADPFLSNAKAFAERHGAAIRFLAVERLLDPDTDLPPMGEGDISLIQPWFTVEPQVLEHALARHRAHAPGARIAFLDSYAHNDLRLGRVVEPYVDFYVKKSLYRDPGQFLRAFRGDTNLTEYYGDLYGIPAPEADWNAPRRMLDKLRLGPNFFTAARFMSDFSRPPPPQAGRSLDMQVRLGGKGSPWYSAMRADAEARAKAIPGLRLSPPGRLDTAAFMAELRDSRLCFSPFGYGELCWRDVEAFATGAVLIKPDMSHLETLPDLYEPGVTYLPVRWDFSDLQEVVENALADEGLRDRIAATAHARIARYLREAQFVEDMQFLFA